MGEILRGQGWDGVLCELACDPVHADRARRRRAAAARARQGRLVCAGGGVAACRPRHAISQPGRRTGADRAERDRSDIRRAAVADPRAAQLRRLPDRGVRRAARRGRARHRAQRGNGAAAGAAAPALGQRLAIDQFRKRALEEWDARLGRLALAMDIVATAMQQRHFAASALAVANELASRLACDRVSVGLEKSGSIEVKAISHTATFDPKMDLGRRIGNERGTRSRRPAGLSAPRRRRARGACAC